MDLQLRGKVAVVTGASAGIGLAVCEALAVEGSVVVGGARRPAERAVDGVEHVIVDLATPAGPEQLIAQAVDRHGRLDVLVNNAGRGEVSDGFLDEGDEHWAATLELNLHACVRAMRAALPHLVDRGGAIINVASINARLPALGVAAYSASKAALLSAGKSVANEYARRGARVVTVSPGGSRRACGSGRAARPTSSPGAPGPLARPSSPKWRTESPGAGSPPRRSWPRASRSSPRRWPRR